MGAAQTSAKLPNFSISAAFFGALSSAGSMNKSLGASTAVAAGIAADDELSIAAAIIRSAGLSLTAPLLWLLLRLT